ncbi:MAG: substrate-binding protein [Burkholderiaceae bacterium]|nr:substrate-binding protein [Burkholderiaceae bacterium]MEB2351888.1 substrate-binding protein [Burkholderiaceae bacterium]
MSNRREFIGASAAVAAAAALPFPAVAARAPIRIGAVLPFSGGLELFGNQAKIGIDLAVAEINAGDGILGSKVEVLYQDNKTDPKTSVERTTQLIQREKVIAVIGPITSSARDAMLPTHRRLKTPLLYATNYEGGACDRYVFSFNTVPNQELEKLVPELVKRAGNTFYLFGADYVWPQKMFEQAEALIRSLGGKVVGREFVPFGTKEFTPILRRIEDSGAKVVLKALPGADGITFIKQAEDLGLMKKVTIGFLGFAETYLGAFGEGKGQNMWVTVPFAASIDDPEVRDFVARVRRSAGNEVPISHYVMTHYNAMKAVQAASTKAGKADRESLVNGLEGLTLGIPTGPMTIGKADHHVTMNMYLARTEGAGLTVVQAMGAIAPQAGCAKK